MYRRVTARCTRAAIIAAVSSLLSRTIIVLCAVVCVMVPAGHVQDRKQLIAHRGASGSAPEHTLASYRLALEQKADFVEPDLGVTKDNVLVCLHDDTLERTTNIAEVFPTRASAGAASRQPGPHWL